MTLETRFAWLTLAIILSVLFPLAMFAQGYSPEEAVKRMTLPDGLRAQLVASEPMISQPVCIEFDDRGRLWVLQYLQYPNPAELNRVKVDRYSRTVYDKIPEPPPRGPKGSDRITILYDFDENARARKSKDFVTGLNLACGIAFGYGGVFVLQVPYLLFYPDKNRDDVPDSDPEVLLAGFGMEDAHSVANSLTWGPDGWLYGCQGSTVTAKIRGIEFQQGIWRYHPPSKRFELFCEGGGNSWGLDFDEDGELIYSTNLSPFRNLHGVQGGYYWKSFGKHGALHNPYTYGYFDHIPYQNFTGGHVCDGGIIYQGTNLPAKYRGKYIANDLLNHAVQWHHMERWGSTFKASYGGELMTSNDTWFAPSDLTMGPDGAIYVADWHDKRTAHPDPDAEWDRRNGRVYKISAAGASSTSPQSLAEEIFGRSVTLPSEKLIKLLGDQNNWLVRKARRILADRPDPSVFPKLRGEVFAAKDEHLALENLWALYVSGGADESFLNHCLDHPSPKIRSWAVRFLGDQEKISPTSAEHLVKLSSKETDVRVRRQFASTAKRLSAEEGLAVVKEILRRNLDSNDPFIPLLLWWAVERNAFVATDRVVELFTKHDIWKSQIGREFILPRVMRRYAAEGTKRGFDACAVLFEASPSFVDERKMLVAIDEGLVSINGSESRRVVAKLRQALAGWQPEDWKVPLIRVKAKLGDKAARELALTVAKDRNKAATERVQMIQLLGEISDEASRDQFIGLVTSNEPESVQIAALDAIQQIADAEVSGLLANYPKMSPRVRSKARDVFFSRKAWAKNFLRGVDEGRYAKDEVPLDQLQKIALLEDKQLGELVRKNWGNISGGTPEEKLADIRRFNNDLRAFSGDAKNGHAVFMKHCGVCHRMFDEGENVGPDLTQVNRDKDFLLTSIVDPSAIIRKEFINYIVETSDGQSLTGIIAEQSANSITLIAAKTERVTVNRNKIASLRESAVSLMPEGLMQGLTPQERRDLFTFLQSEKRAERKTALERIKASGVQFVGAVSGEPFVPLGFNYDHDSKPRLIEEYWDAEWQTVAEDFTEMKQLGANVVRVHLQFAKFMDAPDKPNQKSLDQLGRLLKFAENAGLRLDITGLGCYRKADVPRWYDSATESERWTAQANFWAAIAERCAKSPAVFCYDLMNEPVFPADRSTNWLTGNLGDFYFVQFVTLNPAGRTRVEIAQRWISKLSAAIRAHDKETLVTVGLLPFESAEFVSAISPQLDFIATHIYPERGKVDDALRTLKKFCGGKPVLIEETFPLRCSTDELREFIERSRDDAAGWIGFYWGQTPEELAQIKTVNAWLTRGWLELFEQIQSNHKPLSKK